MLRVESFSGRTELWQQTLDMIRDRPIQGYGFLSFRDYDGMQLELVAAAEGDPRPGWPGGPVPADCPFGPAGDPGDYWGPDAQLTPDAGTLDSGTVTFPVQTALRCPSIGP